MIQEFKLDSDKNTYSAEKAGLLSANNKNEEYSYPSGSVDSQFFQSSATDPQGSFAFGILEKSKTFSVIYLTPVEKILQMRPSFKYFDVSEKNTPGPNDSDAKLIKVGLKASNVKKNDESSKFMPYCDYQQKFKQIAWTQGINFSPNSEGSKKFLNYFCREQNTSALESTEKDAEAYLKQLVSFEDPKV